MQTGLGDVPLHECATVVHQLLGKFQVRVDSITSLFVSRKSPGCPAGHGGCCGQQPQRPRVRDNRQVLLACSPEQVITPRENEE